MYTTTTDRISILSQFMEAESYAEIEDILAHTCATSAAARSIQLPGKVGSLAQPAQHGVLNHYWGVGKVFSYIVAFYEHLYQRV